MTNRPIILAISVGTAILATLGIAQVDIVTRPQSPIANDPLVRLIQSQAPQGRLTYMVPVSVPGPPTRAPSDLVVVPTGSSAGAKEVHRLLPPLAEVAFGPQLLPASPPDNTSSATSILVKVGWPFEELSTYKLYRWNWKTKELTAGPPQSLVFRSVFPSPSGRFVAFFSGGDATGKDWGQPRTQPLTLRVYDWQSKKVLDVPLPPAQAEVAWTPEETLLFSSDNATASQIQQTESKGKAIAIPPIVTRAVYEFNPQDNKSFLLIPNAYAPVVSPDGKQVAVLGWSLPTNQETKEKTPKQQEADERTLLAFSFGAAPAPQLWQFSRSTQVKKLLSAKEPSFYCWANDGKSLIMCEQSYQGESNSGYKNKAAIFQWDEVAQTKTEIAQLETADATPTPDGWEKKRFACLGWESLGSRLVLSKLELTGEDETNGFLLRTTLSVVDVPKKRQSDFAVFEYTTDKMLGFDWDSKPLTE